MDFWSALFDVLLLLAAAMVLGGLCVRLRQSAIVGYLLAGTLLGPHALNWILNDEGVGAIAELGVALLLFSIGLEFSWQRLRRLGWTPLIGGLMQIVTTLLATALVARMFGFDWPGAIAVGAMVALSSTACVLRTLSDRAEMDSIHGRLALGILLTQDMAVVPLVILVAALGGGDGGEQSGALPFVLSVSFQVVLAGLLVGAFMLFSKHVLPRVLAWRTISRTRELPILFAMVTAAGSAWVAHSLELSPALGAFIAGLVLGESPLATQIRSDVGSIKTLFVTLFFAAIGMLADPAWIAAHWWLVAWVVVAVVIGKAAIIWAIERQFEHTHRHSIATGICLAQVGEFSFVLAIAAGPLQGAVINADTFHLIVSVSLVTFFLTPYLIGGARGWGRWIEFELRKYRIIRSPRSSGDSMPASPQRDHVIIIGFGPAGATVAEVLGRRDEIALIVDLNPQTIRDARERGLAAYVGDATSPEILELVHVKTAKAVVITVPDNLAALQTTRQIRRMAPAVPIIARARYHAFVGDLQAAGAKTVVDEEAAVGRHLGIELRRAL